MFAASLAAQVTGVSTYGDGAAVFFTTEMRPIGSDDPLGFKAYRLDPDGVALFAEPEWSSVVSISSSSDGRVVAINRLRECSSGSHCFLDVQESVEIRIGESVRRLDGHAEISANGRYALLLRRTGYGFVTDDVERTQGIQRLRLDLPDSVPEPFGPNPRDRKHLKIADDGSTLSPLPGPLVLNRADGETVDLGVSVDGLDEAWLLSDASGVIYESSTEVDGSRRIRLATVEGADVLLVDDGAIAAVSADGSTLLFRKPVDGVQQLFLQSLSGGSAVQISAATSDVESATLSDDRRTAYYFADGSLVRATSTEREALIAKMPDVDRPEYNPGRTLRRGPSVAPGSAYRIYGRRLSDSTKVAETPAGPRLAGLRVTVNGASAAVLWAAPYEIGYQVNWETELEPRLPVTIVADERSGWEYPFLIAAVTEAEGRNALPEVAGWAVAVHQDFDRLLTLEDQAAPGEYVHLYLTGLGEVSPPVATGSPAPLSPLSRTTSGCASTAFDGETEREIEVLFAGLAPGLTGFYQVTLRVPRDWRRSAFEPSCFGVRLPVNARLAPMGP